MCTEIYWQKLKKDLVVQDEGEEKGGKGIILEKMRYGNGCINVKGVYIMDDMEEKLERLGRWLEEKEEGVMTVLGGDFNARTGCEVERVEWDKEGEEEGEGDRRTVKSIEKGRG